LKRILLGLITVAALGACQPAELSPERANEVTKLVRDYYTAADIGGGFRVGGFRVEGSHVEADLRMSEDEQACGFKSADSSRRDLVFSMACPFADDDVWTALGPATDIRLVVSCRGEEFATHSCRRVHRQGSRSSETSEDVVVKADDAAALEPKDLNILAMRYSNGEGVPKDEAKALELYTRAAVLGFAPAQANTAMHLVDHKDESKAVTGYAWAILASRSDNEFAASIGRNVSADYTNRLTADQQARALHLADSWVVGQDISADAP
jgi:TPR repeat protein